jgi:hypothetical protein
MKPIKGAVSESSAFVIESYPYSFTLRCQKKVWIETDPKRGQRIVEMTSNPKRAGLHWNTPKKSTYSPLCGAFIVEDSDVGKPYGYQSKHEYTADDVGHVHFMRIGSGGDVAFLERYNALFGPFETEYECHVMHNELAMARAGVRLDQWKEEHPAPKWDLQMTDDEKQVRRDWESERAKVLGIFFTEEHAKIRASDEVPMPKAAPVAPAQNIVPEGAMF